MPKTINKKPINTNTLVNKCKCKKNVLLRKCIWVEECENMLEVFTEHSKSLFENNKTKPLRLTEKHKQRKFFFGICSCGRIYYYKS